MNKKDAQAFIREHYADDVTDSSAVLSQVALSITSGEERADLLRRIAAIDWQLKSVMGTEHRETFEDFCDKLIESAEFLRSRMPKELEEVVESL